MHIYACNMNFGWQLMVKLMKISQYRTSLNHFTAIPK
jgi:hypothetical protein